MEPWLLLTEELVKDIPLERRKEQATWRFTSEAVIISDSYPNSAIVVALFSRDSKTQNQLTSGISTVVGQVLYWEEMYSLKIEIPQLSSQFP